MADLIDHEGNEVAASSGGLFESNDLLSSASRTNFVEHYNRKTFMFPHGLCGHPLLAIPSLVALADRLGSTGNSYWSNGSIEVDSGWDKGEKKAGVLAKAISEIASNDSLVMLKGVVRDPVVGPFLKTVLNRIVELVGPKLEHDMIDARATILIASPKRITTYHADADVNFLMQIAGDKDFSVFDHNDRKLVTEAEAERFLLGEHAAIRFRPEQQQHAVTHDLRPGYGAHVPCLAPHWAQNGNAMSVAISFNFDLRSIRQRTNVYKVNHHLRRLGLHPALPGNHVWADQLKHRSAEALLGARHLIRSAQHPFHHGDRESLTS